MKKNISKGFYVVKNWISYLTGIMLPVPVGYVIIGVTYLCSAKCKMCQIYDFYKRNPELRKEELDSTFIFKRLKESHLIKKIKHIDLTGGEPFLKEDLKKLIINIFTLPNIGLVTINTNALLPEKIISDTEAILKTLGKNKFFSISISIDGAGKIHDEIRGVEGAFSRVEQTVDGLKTLREKYPSFLIRSNTVMQPQNIDCLAEIKNYWNKHNIKGAFSLLQAPFYTHSESVVETNMKFSSKDIEKIKLAHPKSVGMNYYLDNNFKRPLHCFAGYSSIFIDPLGKVFPCNFLAGNDEYVMGNIKESSIDSLWAARTAANVRKKIKSCSYVSCWNGCEVDQTMLQFEFLNRVIKLLSLGFFNYYKLRGLKGFK